MTDPLLAVLGLHRLYTETGCGAVSIPLTHHHGPETDSRPGPKRSLTCSEEAGHDGLHRDARCCWSFQKFEDWQVLHRKPTAFDSCAGCGGTWPCNTIASIQEAAL